MNKLMYLLLRKGQLLITHALLLGRDAFEIARDTFFNAEGEAALAHLSKEKRGAGSANDGDCRGSTAAR